MNRIIHYLTIEKLALNGYGLGFDEGKAVFVPYTMPGDVVDVAVTVDKAHTVFGHALDFIHTSPLSIPPGCEAFGGEDACGGCDWLMAPYRTQVFWKTGLIKEVFAPAHLDDKVMDTVASPTPENYRNKVFLPAVMTDGGLRFGIFRRFSHDVVTHKSCRLQPPVMDEILAVIEEFAHTVKLEAYDEKTHTGTLRHAGIRINSTGDAITVILVTRSARFPFTNQLVRLLTSRFPQITGIIQNINPNPHNIILDDKDKVLFGSPYLQDTLGDMHYRIHYQSFFQINHSTALLLYNHLKDNLKPGENVLDAYSGSGSIALFVADKVQAVTGVEEFAPAVEDANFNKELNHIDKATFLTAKVEDVLPSLMQEHAFSTVILDPPRKGVESSSLLALASARIPHILYVSCSPMTLKRDVELLLTKGYTVEHIRPFDMFPQTWHIETVVSLRLEKEGNP